MKCHHSQGVQNLIGLMNTETDNYNICGKPKDRVISKVLQEQRGSSRGGEETKLQERFPGGGGT